MAARRATAILEAERRRLLRPEPLSTLLHRIVDTPAAAKHLDRAFEAAGRGATDEVVRQHAAAALRALTP